jgi:hypothetical protein
VSAILQTGETARLVQVPGGSTQLELARVRYFYIAGSESGYVRVPRAFTPAAVARLIFPSSQSSNPRPGPSLALRLAPVSHWRDLSLRVTMAPARTAEEAAAFVNQL